MKKKIIINAIYPEEKRVAIVEGETLVDFYVEVSSKEHLKGNIYKGIVARVEPGLQAVFVDFGQKKQGFLQFREIDPQYFKKTEGGKRPRVQDVIEKGQEVIVQVEKDARDTKGASLTTFISIPGRYIVMMPGQEKVGISRKIEGKEDRDKMKEIFSSLKLPKNMGFILRTAGIGRTGNELENDLKYLTKLWSKIQAESKKVKAPELIYKEQDIAVRTVRDYLTDDVSEVLIDDRDAYGNMREFLKKTLPWMRINIKLSKDKKPVFTRHNIEDQIAKIHERYVHLPSRGYLVIDKTEALTAIDVNSGRSRKEANVESTAFKTNLEAADEIARQMRLRDIGGLIVIDFIDMASSKSRREVEERLNKALYADKAHTEIAGISKFGLLEMTRERMRPAYFESMNRNCEYCEGAGIVKTDEMVAIAALRDLHTKTARGGITAATIHLPVESANYLINTNRDWILEIEKEFSMKINIIADKNIALGKFQTDFEKAEVKTESKPVVRAHAKDPKRAHAKNPVKAQAKNSEPGEIEEKQ